MLTSVEQVISAIGGNNAAAELAGVSCSAVSNWKFRQRIPPEFFLIFTEALERSGGARVDPGVFAMRSTDEAAA